MVRQLTSDGAAIKVGLRVFTINITGTPDPKCAL